MLKLATPIQYEDSLDELNTIRPLSLTDEGKIELVIPILNVNPVSSGRPVIGKLLRCNQVGSLVGNSSIGYSNVQELSHIFSTPPRTWLCQFSQVVSVVVLRGTILVGSPVTWWSDSTYTAQYASVVGNTFIIIRFVGDKLYLYCADPVGGVQGINVKGYY